jgi:NAD(P)-dependent dehydrogenase (short-subunit alcohol dehydrogenase family)
VVSGGNTGIGQETVKALLNHNAKVFLAARSATKANAAIAELKQQTGKEAIFLQLDLSDIPSVRKSAEEFLSYARFPRCVLGLCANFFVRKESQLHILVNNA